MSRVHVQMGSVMSSHYTINIMVADVLTWDIHQVTNSLCRIQIYRVFSKHNTYMCRYIARMYNRSRLVDARPSTFDMLTKRWIYRLNDVSNRVKHVVQVIKKQNKTMFEISRTQHWRSIVRRFFFVISGFVTSRMVEHTMHKPWRHAHQVLYLTDGNPVAAAIMSCGLISKLFESSLWLKNRGSCVQACGVIYEGTPLISSTFGLGTFFRRLAFIVKSKLLLFLFAFFVLFCFVYCTPGIILTMNKVFNYSDTTWAPWRFRTKTNPNKRPKLCITNPLCVS